jgi:hypothetical protein
MRDRRVWQAFAGACIALLIGAALAMSSGAAELALGLVFCGVFSGGAAVYGATRKD